MNIRKINISVFVIFISAISVYSNCQVSNDSSFYWDCRRNLEWQDFRGVMPDSTVFGAASSIGIKAKAYWEEGKPNIRIRTGFYSYEACKKYPTEKPNLIVKSIGTFLTL